MERFRIFRSSWSIEKSETWAISKVFYFECLLIRILRKVFRFSPRKLFRFLKRNENFAHWSDSFEDKRKMNKRTHLMQLSGSGKKHNQLNKNWFSQEHSQLPESQSVLHLNRSHDNQPIGGVRANPFSKLSTCVVKTKAKSATATAILLEALCFLFKVSMIMLSEIELRHKWVQMSAWVANI